MKLCVICSHFDFEGLLDVSDPLDVPDPLQGYQKAGQGYQLGSIAEIRARRHCPLCYLISRGITCYWPSAPHTEVIVIFVKREGDYRYLGVHSDYGRDIEVDKAEPWKTAFSIKQPRKTTVALNLYPARGTSRAKCITSRHVLPKLDISIPRRWVQRCDEEHRLDCDQASSVSGDLPDGFMLIDVNARCIIQAPIRARFFALSYVWGNASGQFRTSKRDLKASSNNNGSSKLLLPLPDQLPQVIEDAIQFVRDFGETYLWVDALCIIHDDASHLTAQLNAMDRIYAGAVLTIIAAPGFSFSNHLPGYSKTPRLLLSINGEIAGLEFVVRLPVEHAAIDGLDRSAWIHRAWTFQEGLLAKRRLIFTNQEVFFICGTDLWSESRQDPPSGSKILPSPWGSTDDDTWVAAFFNNRSLQSPLWQFKHYTSLVKGYLSRDLTYIGDSLNAFRGLERRMQTSTGIKFFWGLPEGEDFHQALLWQIPDPQASSPIRDGFPMWSWAGWFKAPYYIRIPKVSEEPTVDEPPHVRGIGTKFWKETEDGKIEEIDTTTKMGDLHKRVRTPPQQYKSHMYVEGMTAEFEVRQASATGDPHLLSRGVDIGPVKFQRVSRSDVTRTIIDKSWQFLAISESVMWLAERDARNFQFNMHRVTVGKDNKKDYGPLNAASRLIKDRNWSVYNTMVLEWQGGTAKCVAMCQIRDEIWNAASPQQNVVKVR